MEKTAKTIEILNLISNALNAWEVLRANKTFNDAAKRLKNIPSTKSEQYVPGDCKEETWIDSKTGKVEKVRVFYSDDPHKEMIDDYDPYSPEEVANDLQMELLIYLDIAVKATDEANAAMYFCLFPVFSPTDAEKPCDKNVINKVTQLYPRISEIDLKLEYMALSWPPTMQKNVAQMVEDAMNIQDIGEYRDIEYYDENQNIHYTWPCLEFLNGRGYNLRNDVHLLKIMVHNFDSACEKLQSIYSPVGKNDVQAELFIDKYKEYIPETSKFVIKLKTMKGRDVSNAYKKYLQTSNVSLKEFCNAIKKY